MEQQIADDVARIDADVGHRPAANRAIAGAAAQGGYHGRTRHTCVDAVDRGCRGGSDAGVLNDGVSQLPERGGTSYDK